MPQDGGGAKSGKRGPAKPGGAPGGNPATYTYNDTPKNRHHLPLAVLLSWENAY